MSFNVKTRLSKLKASAKERKYNINLDVNKYQVLIDAGCYYCGKSLANENGYCLDRVDSSKGYNIQNLVGCCKICNRAKSNMSVYEFIDWVKKAFYKISEHEKIAHKMQELGITQEVYDKIAEEFMKIQTEGKEKFRIKEVYSNE